MKTLGLFCGILALYCASAHNIRAVDWAAISTKISTIDQEIYPVYLSRFITAATNLGGEYFGYSMTVEATAIGSRLQGIFQELQLSVDNQTLDAGHTRFSMMLALEYLADRRNAFKTEITALEGNASKIAFQSYYDMVLAVNGTFSEILDIFASE